MFINFLIKLKKNEFFIPSNLFTIIIFKNNITLKICLEISKQQINATAKYKQTTNKDLSRNVHKVIKFGISHEGNEQRKQTSHSSVIDGESPEKKRQVGRFGT